MDQLRVGFLVLAAAPAAWIVAALTTHRMDYLFPLGIVLAGAVLAAWAVPAQRRVLGPVGIAIAALGMGVFYGFDLSTTLDNRAAGIVLLGLAMVAISIVADAPRGLAAGLVVIAGGGLLWLYLDWGKWEWLPGEALLVVGALVSAVPAWRHG